MKIRTTKKVIKEFMIKGRKTPLARKVKLEHLVSFAASQDKKSENEI
jgi:hypothetical protein